MTARDRNGNAAVSLRRSDRAAPASAPKRPPRLRGQAELGVAHPRAVREQGGHVAWRQLTQPLELRMPGKGTIDTRLTAFSAGTWR